MTRPTPSYSIARASLVTAGGWRRWPLLAFAMAGLAATAQAGEAPRVVASIAPVHSLASAVMEGVGTPGLIVRGFGSPHTWQMRPSEAAMLERADIVFWIGAPLEAFLIRPLASLGPATRRVALIGAPGVTVLPARAGGAWQEDADEEHEHHGDEAGERPRVDPHIWLAPGNAQAMTRAIVAALAEHDPERADLYRANGEQVLARIDRLAAALDDRLAPVREVPFVVLHDAYQYFEHRFGLNAVGSITTSLESQPGARRLRNLVALGARCVFGEPQVDSPLVDTVIAGTRAGRGTLDPLGAGLTPGPDAYFEMMDSLAGTIHDCLSGAT